MTCSIRRAAAVGAFMLPGLAMAAGAAEASTVEGANGTLTYTAAPGELNYVGVGTGESPNSINIGDSGVSTMTPSGTCRTYSTGQYGSPLSVECTDITRVVIRMGDANDGISALAAPVPIEMYGEAGDDKLLDGWQADVLDGGDGTDEIDMSGTYGEHIGSLNGADMIRGGAGTDHVIYSRTDSSSVSLSNDGVPNDGAANEADNIAADVEQLTGGAGDDTLTGSAGPDSLNGGLGNDTINGLGGDDTLEGLGGRDVIDGGAGRDSFSGSAEADTIRARDGEVDTISCGSDADQATTDADDIVAANALDWCESVDSGSSTTPSPSSGGTGGGPTPAGTAPAAGLAVARAVARPNGTARFTLDAPGAGVLRLRATAATARARAARRLVVGGARRTTAAAGRYSVTLKPNRSGKRLLRRRGKLRVRVAITFAPSAGAAQTTKRTLTLRLRR